jgi:hypothetical protein
MKQAIIFILTLLSFEGFSQVDSTTTPTPLLTPQVLDSTKAAKNKKQLMILPAKVGFNLDKGESASQAITIQNTLDDTMRINFSFVDWERDSTGQHKHYYKPGFTHSCQSWVSFDRSYVEVAPGQTEVITVTMKIPDSASAIEEMKWAMLLATPMDNTVMTKGKNYTTGVRKTSSLGIHLYQTPPSITKKEVKMISFTELTDKSYRITSENTGGLQTSTLYSIELTSLSTGERTKLGPNEAPLFPGQRRVMDFKLPETIAKGKYTAVAIVDVSDDEVALEVAEKEIEVK